MFLFYFMVNHFAVSQSFYGNLYVFFILWLIILWLVNHFMGGTNAFFHLVESFKMITFQRILKIKSHILLYRNEL